MSIDPIKYCIKCSEIAMYYEGKQDFENALKYFKKILPYNPTNAQLNANISTICVKLYKFTEAEEALLRAYKREPTDDVVFKLANIYYYKKNYKKALHFFKEVWADNHIYKHTAAFSVLAMKDFRKGFELNEHRLMHNVCPQTNKPQRVDIPAIPDWDGQAPCKRLLVVSEQGFGDMFQYYRYLIELAERRPDIQIAFFCHPHVAHLFQNDCPNVTKCETVDMTAYDYKCYLMSLPYVLRVETVAPNTHQYIKCNDQRRAYWQAQMDPAKLNVAIKWSGELKSDIQKAIDVGLFAEISGVNFISLEFDKRPPADSGIKTYDLDKDAPFVDTIEIIRCVDLVVTVDTSIVHLAGVLGAPTLLMLGYVSEWRWFDTNERVWYDSVEIIRLKSPGHLNGIFPQVKDRLLCVQKAKTISADNQCATRAKNPL